MSSDVDLEIITDLVIRKAILEKNLREENERTLRIEPPSSYDYNPIVTQKTSKEPRRVIIIDI